MTAVRQLVVTLTVALPFLFAETPIPNCRSTLCRLVASGSLPSLRQPDFSDYRTRIRAFYEPSGYTFAWTGGGIVTGQATRIIQMLKGADAKGLNPEDYDGSRWDDRLARLRERNQARSEADLAEFDVALTVCTVRFVSDLHFGRANPGLFHGFAAAQNEALDLPTFLRMRLIHASDVKVVLEGIEPPYEGYRRTEEALQQYLAMARDYRDGLLPVAATTVEPGDSYAGLTDLAARLRLLGDLPEKLQASPDADTYTDPLVGAVKHFQMRHGLQPDGRLGKATLAQLNTPLAHRIRQLQLTLERWRWVPA